MIRGGLMNSVALEKVEFMGWKNCIKISNEIVELIITTDVGPRIISYGFAGDRNEFCVWNEQAGLSGGDKWRCYGGSRLWHGPEVGTRCYEPDNIGIRWEQIENGIILKQDTEPWTKIRKEISITLDNTSTLVRFGHRIINESPWDANLCIWVLTLMDSNGVCIIPAPNQVKDMSPNSVLPIGAIAFWPYTSLTDSRFKMSDKYFVLRHNPGITQNFKIGMPVFEGWAAYVNKNHMFVKYFEHKIGEEYPDFSSSFELYCCERFTEVETLSPMRKLKNGESLEHYELWELHNNVKTPENDEEIDSMVLPLIRKESGFAKINIK
jgi:hypothetical protein